MDNHQPRRATPAISKAWRLLTTAAFVLVSTPALRAQASPWENAVNVLQSSSATAKPSSA